MMSLRRLPSVPAIFRNNGLRNSGFGKAVFGIVVCTQLFAGLCFAVCDVDVHHLMNYEKLQQLRLEEAVRTVLILHPTHSSPVVELCQRYGHIKNAISFRHNMKV